MCLKLSTIINIAIPCNSLQFLREIWWIMHNEEQMKLATFILLPFGMISLFHAFRWRDMCEWMMWTCYGSGVIYYDLGWICQWFMSCALWLCKWISICIMNVGSLLRLIRWKMFGLYLLIISRFGVEFVCEEGECWMLIISK
jgi:hypothetical protein